MIIPRREVVQHKNQLLRLLRAILSNNLLANELAFKGGTYAALLNLIDRFSIDLDFDLLNKDFAGPVRRELYKVFSGLGLEIKDESKNYLQFFLKYPAPPNKRNTLNLDINDRPSRFNVYQRVQLSEIRMVCLGHAPGTMFANKLVAAKARFNKNGKIAGRDFFDIHRFFERGIEVHAQVVEDLTGMSYVSYLEDLQDFISRKLTEKLLRQDLNPLIKPEVLNKILPYLKDELLLFFDQEIQRNLEQD